MSGETGGTSLGFVVFCFEDERIFKSVAAESNPEVREFLESELECVKRIIVKNHKFLNRPINKKAHSRHRHSAEITGIRKQRQDLKRSLEAKLGALEGRTLQPVVIKREKGELTGWGLGTFSFEDASWWKYIKFSRPDYSWVSKEDMKIIRSAFDFRLGWKQGDSEARQNYFDLISSLEERTDLDRYLRDITEHVGRN